MGGFVRGVTEPGSPTDRPAHFPEEEGLGLEVGSQVGWGRDFQKGVGPVPSPGRAWDYQGSPPDPAGHLPWCPVWALSSPEDEVTRRWAVVAPPHTAIGLAGASLRGQDLAASLGVARAWCRGELTAAPHLHHGPEGAREGLKEPRVAARGVESTAGPPCTCCQATQGEKPQQAPRTEITVMLKTT